MFRQALVRRHRSVLFGTAVLVAAAIPALGLGDSPPPGQIPQAGRAQLEAAGLAHLRLAPLSKRVDLRWPSFSNPTRITNPLFPIARLRSTILEGRVDGQDFRTETTLLPYTRIFGWPKGRHVETLVSQYAAYQAGRLEEVALDFYAQADDGSVWYFGEEVYNYRDGAIADRAGTWLAGRDGPAAMIMPARPRVGDVWHSENVPGFVFEEVTAGGVGRTVVGPSGPVAGAMVGLELHQDGKREAKTFAPGYGEFFTGQGGDIEAMALAVPQDGRPGGVPPRLAELSRRADAAYRAVRARRWAAAASAAAGANDSWHALRPSDLPPRLAKRAARAVARLGPAVASRRPSSGAHAALDVAAAAVDLQLRYGTPVAVDRGRFRLWARRLTVDAAAKDTPAVAGDLATLEWVRDRFAHTLDVVTRTRLDTRLRAIRTSVTDGDLRQAAVAAVPLSG
jgi:hypothetical protein